MNKYILEGHEPKPIDDIMQWAKWYEKADRIVEQTTIGDVKVSTVFLGLDHNYDNDGTPPILFETMIFGGEQDMYQDRYCTWDEAVEGHKKACELLS